MMGLQTPPASTGPPGAPASAPAPRVPRPLPGSTPPASKRHHAPPSTPFTTAPNSAPQASRPAATGMAAPAPTGYSKAPAPAGYSKARSIIRQVEYYFCDENLAKDKFMSQKIAEANSGMVSFEVIHSCPRIDRLNLSIICSREELTSFARKSQVLIVTEDGTLIGRRDLHDLAERALRAQAGA